MRATQHLATSSPAVALKLPKARAIAPKRDTTGRGPPRWSWALTCALLPWALIACSGSSNDDDPNPSNGAPIIERFEAAPGGGLPIGGGPVTLSWSVMGADSITIDQGVGEVDGTEASASVSESTLFTLTATNAQGASEASAIALVATSGPPPIDRTVPTSADQVEEAFARGDIDDITALRYRVFALFGDDRLPAEFDAEGRTDGAPIMFELASRFDDLPSEVQEELRPFQLPPDDPGSWYAARNVDLPSAKGTITNTFDPPIIIADGRVALSLASSLTDTQKLFSRIVIAQALEYAYPILIDLMGRPAIGNGSDPMVYPVRVIDDPALTDLGLATATSPLPGGGWRSHFQVNLNGVLLEAISDGIPFSGLLAATVAHELFHGIQFTFDTDVQVGDDWVDESVPLAWLMESTATWVEHFVYPELNTEQGYANLWFRRPYIPLDDLRGTHEYGGYLFHLYMTERLGNTDVIRGFWEAAERLPVFEAIDEALGGQLVDFFTEFAVANWNDGYIREYRIIDGLESGVSMTAEGSAEPFAVPNRTFVTGFSLDRVVDEGFIGPERPGVRHLSAQYARLSFEDDNTRSLLFSNGFNYELLRDAPTDLPIEYEGDAFYVRSESFTDILDRNTRTQVLVKSQGEWTGPYDLTTVPFVAFCQDLPEESVEELVFIFSNANFEEGQLGGVPARGIIPTMLGSNVACGRWQGTAAGTSTATPAPGNPDLTLLEFEEVTFEKLVFTREPAPIPELVEGSPTTILFNYEFSAFIEPSYKLTLTDAEVEWNITYAQSSGGVSCSGEGATDLGATQLFGLLWTYNHFLPEDPDYRTHLIEVSPLVDLTFDVTCDASPPNPRNETFQMSSLDNRGMLIDDDGITIEGSDDRMTEGGIANILEQWSWELSAGPSEDAP